MKSVRVSLHSFLEQNIAAINFPMPGLMSEYLLTFRNHETGKKIRVMFVTMRIF